MDNFSGNQWMAKWINFPFYFMDLRQNNIFFEIFFEIVAKQHDAAKKIVKKEINYYIWLQQSICHAREVTTVSTRLVPKNGKSDL